MSDWSVHAHAATPVGVVVGLHQDRLPAFQKLVQDLMERRMTADMVSVGVYERFVKSMGVLEKEKARGLALMVGIRHAQQLQLKDARVQEALQICLRNELAAVNHGRYAADASFHQVDKLLQDGHFVDEKAKALLVDDASAMRKIGAELENAVRQKLADPIAECFWDLYDSTVSAYSTDSGSVSAARDLHTVPDVLQHVLHRNDTMFHEVRSKRNALLNQVLSAERVLAECHSVANALVMDHVMGGEAHAARAHADWLIARVQGLQSKIQTLKYSFLSATYLPSHTSGASQVNALRAIRNSVQQRIDGVKAELAEVSRKIREYESVGSTFKGIAAEYGKIIDETEHVTNAITEAKKV